MTQNRRDRRLGITPEAVAKIARATYPEHRVFELYDRLIVDNDRIGGDADKHWESLTRGQQLLVRLAVFDMEVCNGGVEQYFWNRPDRIFEIHGLLESLDVRPLTEAYEGALQALAGKETPWLRLRERFAGASQADLQLFLDSVELLDLQAFDSTYYGEWDGHGTKLKPGLGNLLGDGLLEYVLAHPAEFCAGT